MKKTFALLFLFSSNLHAATYTVDLTTQTLFDSSASTGLWNTLDARIQAPLAGNGGSTSAVIDFGVGSDGAFNDGPTQTGITVLGATITFDTSVKSTYEFSSFNLSGGNTIQTQGSNPLVIQVAGATTISGNINLDGSTGGVNSQNTGGTGATGEAGGGSGGEGSDASPISAGTAGTPSSGVPRGGLPGGDDSSVVPTRDYQGGGGGCNGWTGVVDNLMNGQINGLHTVVVNMGDCSSKTHAVVANDFDSTFLGGGGGGGGGALNGGTVASGAGGASGGGAFRISALGNISLGGAILARGGAGGAANFFNGVADCGGAGGGGGGGSVWIQSAKTFSGAGNINVSSGAGGISGICAGFDGGRGSRGVVRLDTGTGNTFPSGNILPASSSDLSSSIVSPSGQTYVVYSRAIDFSSIRASFQPPSITTGCGTVGVDGSVTVTFQGSNDGVNYGAEVSSQNISLLNDSAYIRFKVTISTLTTTPPCLTALSFDYTNLGTAGFSDFTLQGGLFCGKINPTQRSTQASSQAWGDFVLLGIVLVITFGIKKFLVLRRSPLDL